MFSGISLEVGDKLVQSILHVHMSNFTPHLVVVIKNRLFLLRCSLFVRKDIPNDILSNQITSQFRENEK